MKRKSNKKVFSLLWILLALPLTSQALNFSGYYRLGVGGNTNGSTQSCFKLPGARSKYRLGNECELWSELAWDHQIALADGSTLSGMVMGGFYNPIGHLPKFKDSSEHGGGSSRIQQMFLELKGSPLLNGGNFWVGRRYYKRNDIHMTDYYYWNQSATGFGFDEVPIGDLRYSYVFSRKDNYYQKPYINRHDFNVNGFKTNPGGEVQLGFSYVQKPDSHDAHSGWAVSVQHKQAGFLGGRFNTFALQYGEGPGTGLGYTGDTTLNRNNKIWRVVEYFDWQTTERFGGQFQFVYEKNINPDGPELRWMSTGIRPVYAITEQFKLSGEVGHDQVMTSGGTRKLTKFTVAPTWSLSGPGFWDRPEVRIYYTYATWNKAAQRAAAPDTALSDTGAFGSNRHGGNFGLQVEYWWK